MVGVQSITIPLTPATKALVGLVALYTLTHVLSNPYAESAINMNKTTVFKAIFTIINLTPLVINYFNN